MIATSARQSAFDQFGDVRNGRQQGMLARIAKMPLPLRMILQHAIVYSPPVNSPAVCSPAENSPVDFLISRWFVLVALILLTACSEPPWNNPHPPLPPGISTYQSMIAGTPPKHLDPAISYAADEALFIMQIYEPPMDYHFLKRPYELIPGALEGFPQVTFLNARKQEIEEGEEPIAFSRYTLRLRGDLHYQPHPAFARDDAGQPRYLFDNAAAGDRYRKIGDFEHHGDRPVHARDYAYAIKRLADPHNGSPMLGLMSQYIVGMQAFSDRVGAVPRDAWVNLENYTLAGLEVEDERTVHITIVGRYPQFIYWLAMPFFSPIAPEVDQFYHNPGFADRNLTLDWWPVGSGPYMMVNNDPNSEIVLERNPNYREEFFPSEGAPGDLEAGYLEDAGKRIPFVDRAVYRLEKESLSLWTKFLQGYYDRSGESHGHTTGVFDQAFTVGQDGVQMSAELLEHGITMSTDVKPGLYYYGFNMRDPVVGGYTEEKRKLRQALQIAFNTEEYINIFYKGNGIAAHNIIPPGIPGHLTGEAGMNYYMYDWIDGEPRRKSLHYARRLLAEAGYPGGRDERTGEPLKIFIDVQSQAISGTSMRWIDRTFSEIGVQVEFRPADWSRTREKLLTGNTQIFSHGWLADYPDPENFLFLLYSPESPLICECDGANNSNYENAEYDDLFRKVRVMPPGVERQALVARMVELFRHDAVWLNPFYTREIYLNNAWVHNTKRHGISKAVLKYIRVDDELRQRMQAKWNEPVTWPLYAVIVVLLALVLPGTIAYRRRQNATVANAER